MAPDPGAGQAAGQAPQLGLCLSGGGFRAAFYVFGVLRYLAEKGSLPDVGVVSAVSGGSIGAAMLADRWEAFERAGGDLNAFLAEVDGPFREVVTKKNLRNDWLLHFLLHPTAGGRGKTLGQTLSKHLYEHDRVDQLPDRPQVIFTSTDLGVGRAFRAARHFAGSFDHGYVEPAPATLGLGTAVAASAAFPPSLSVVSLSTRALGLPKGDRTLSLVDGGVYDNMGLEWFQGWDSGRPDGAIRPGYVIVANASGQLGTPDRKYGALRSIFRDQSVFSR